MSKGAASLLHVVRTMTGVYRHDGRSDEELLAHYAATHDERSFATLVIRHGPMIWSICSRILSNVDDVDDASQVVLMTLAAKAGKIRLKTVAGWLHEVARRTALHARKTAWSRKKLQDALKAVSRAEAVEEIAPNEAHEALHEEVAKLPEKLRATVILHYFETKKQAEVAEILGVTEQTVWNRLAQGKAILAKRLGKRGLAFATAGLTALLSEAAAPAALPPGFATKSLQTAAAFRAGKLSGPLAKLAVEAVKHAPTTTPWWKSGWMITVLCVGSLGFGVGGVEWKSGLFRATDEGQTAVVSAKALKVSTKEEPVPPRLDLYGDPLPPGAVARLGTTRLRILSDALGAKGSLAFTEEGRSLLTSDIAGPVRLSEASSGRLQHKFAVDVSVFALSRDRRILATGAASKKGGLQIWDLKSCKLLCEDRAADLPGWEVALAISPDGKMAAAAGPPLKDCIQLWDVSTGSRLPDMVPERRPPKQAVQVRFLAFSDNKTLIGADETEVYLWDVQTGKEIRRMGKKENHRIAAFDYSPDRRRAAVGCRVGNGMEFQGTASVWDVDAGKEMWQIPEPNAMVTAVAFAPDGRTIATGDFRGSVHLWNTADGRKLNSYKGCQGSAKCVAFSPNGKLLAAGCDWQDQTVRLWDVPTGRDVTPMRTGHRSHVTAAVFIHNDREIVSSGLDGAYRVWDAATGAECSARTLIGDSGHAWPVIGGVSSDGESVAFVEKDYTHGGQKMRFLRRSGGDACHSAALGSSFGFWASFSSDGRTLACAGIGAGGYTNIFDVALGRPLKGVVGCGGVVALSSDGKFLAGEGGGKGFIGVWDAKKERSLCAFPAMEEINQGLGHETFCLAFDPYGRMLAVSASIFSSGRYVRKLKLWDLQPLPGDSRLLPLCRHDIDFPAAERSMLAFSQDARLIAAADEDGAIHVWETATGGERTRFQGHEQVISSLAFSADGRRLASGSRDTTILIWDLTGRLRQSSPMIFSSQQEIESFWKDLASNKSDQAGRAIWTLASAGEPTVRFLKIRLQPPRKRSAATTARISQSISGLDDDDFKVRTASYRALAELEEMCEADLLQALKRKPSVHASRSIKALLLAIAGKWKAPSGEVLRSLRAVEVLEHIGTPSARRVLQELAAGAEWSRQTKEAQSAAARLEEASNLKR